MDENYLKQIDKVDLIEELLYIVNMNSDILYIDYLTFSIKIFSLVDYQSINFVVQSYITMCI